MKKLMNVSPLLAFASVILVFDVAVSAQAPGQHPPAIQETTEAQLPNSKGGNPKPKDATNAILAAFDKYEVVGMDAAHGNKDVDDFILHLVRNPAFPTKVNDIAVECGNSLYQSILDRYIAGEDVPLSEVRQVWRNTTASMCSVSGFYEILFPLVRRINQKLSAKKIRVLAGDPPLDWSKVKEQSDVMLDRDANIASVMEKEVLSKHRKALMLFGTFHLFHNSNVGPIGLESAVKRYERKYPGVTMVIGTAIVSRNPIPPAVSETMEARMASWPVPSLVQNLKATWLEDVDHFYFSQMVDAYLYLGPPDLSLVEPRPAEMFLNKDYMAELRRRAAIIGDQFITAQTDPDQISDQHFSPFLYDPDAFRKTLQSLGIGPSASAAAPSQEGPPWRPPDRPKVIHLSPEALNTFVGKYAPESPVGVSIPPIEIVADQDGLWVDLGVGTGKRKFVPLSSLEFTMNDAPATRITFTQDEKGQTVGLTFKGLWTNKATKLP